MLLFTKIRVLIVGVLLLLGVLQFKSLFLPNEAQAQSAPTSAAGQCEDFETKWYNCWNTYRAYQRHISSWCSQAPRTKAPGTASKYDQCVLRLTASLNLRPLGLNPAVTCKPTGVSDGFKHAKENPGCWATLLNSGDAATWKRYLAKLNDDCPDADASDARECAEGVQLEFLTSIGLEPTDGDATGLTGGGTGRTAQRTPFMTRVAAYIQWFIVGMGILAVFGFVIAGIQYSAAQNNPQAIAAAKNRMVSVVMGIIIYMVMFAALQWLIPGGVF